MTDLRSGPREPFGPRQPGVWGGVLRLCQWVLAIITVVCIWPGVMLVLTAVTDFMPLLRGGTLPPVSTLLIHAEWVVWAALLVMTAVRLSYGKFRWWVFAPVAAAHGALAFRVMPDAADPVGRCIWLIMLGVTGVQVLLHGLWSLSARMQQKHNLNRTEEHNDEQEA